jgi:hypothetical protein
MNRTNRTPHPIREVLRAQGRSVAWLARRIGRRDSYVRGVLQGHWPAVADFRARCAAELEMAEGDLFLVDHGASGVSRSEASPIDGSTPADGTGLGGEAYRLREVLVK